MRLVPQLPSRDPACETRRRAVGSWGAPRGRRAWYLGCVGDSVSAGAAPGDNCVAVLRSVRSNEDGYSAETENGL